jgi:alpha-mannosidase
MQQEGRRRVHVIPQTHYDAEVFLSREETFERGFDNIERALSMLARHPAFTFALDQVCYVRPYLERYPEKREELLHRVREGRLTLEGGMHVMPDMNLPCGESFIRQVFYGRRFFQDELGADPKCGWILDSFGCPPQTPQVLAGCGYDWNIIQRGAPADAGADFLWQGIDGTRLYTHNMPLGYAVLFSAPADIHQFKRFVDARLAMLEKECDQPGLLALTGADITPPEEHLPAMMEAYNKLQDRYELVFSTPQKYFEEVMENGMLTAIAGDFNGVFHGCYSARIRMKQRNRECETALLDWEKSDAAAALAAAPSAPSAAAPQSHALSDAWEPVLFNQFHDIICGSHVDVVYRAAMDRFDFSEELARTATGRNLQQIADSVDTSGDGVPVVVFNTLGFARSDPVEAGFAFAAGAGFEVEVRDSSGTPVPSDLVAVTRAADGSILRGRALFIARGVPSFGYEVYRIIPLPAGSPPGGAAKSDISSSIPLNLRDNLDEGFIANGGVRVGFDLWKGVVTSLVEKTGKWDCISPAYRRGNTVAREQDFGNFWQYNGPCKGDLFHPPMDGEVSRGLYPLPPECANGASFSHSVDGDAHILTGRAHAELSIDHPWGSGFFATRVRVYASIPRVEFRTTLVNNDERVRYRAAFPTSIAGGTITHEIPFGAVERPEGEYPAQTWMDYGESGPGGSRGLTLLNRGLPGNNVSGGVMMLSLLKCTALKEGYGESGGFKLGVATEMGYEKGVRHEFHYALLPHAGDWRQARVWEQGHGFTTPLVPVKTSPHAGALPKRHSWISVSDPRVVLSAVRRSGRGIVIRVYETTGAAVKDARITLSCGVREVVETDLVERNPRPLPGQAGREISLPLNGFQIRTIEVIPGA